VQFPGPLFPIPVGTELGEFVAVHPGVKRVFDRQQVIELRTQGLSPRAIASQLALGEGTVRRVLRDFTGSTRPRRKPAAEII
jgi:Homeodomain-like domain